MDMNILKPFSMIENYLNIEINKKMWKMIFLFFKVRITNLS